MTQASAQELLALADAVAAATGPDRHLDAMIHYAFKNGVGSGYACDSPAYTASLDAAMALVPEGYDLSGASSGPIDGWRRAEWHVRFAPRQAPPREGGYSFEQLRALCGEGDGATFALALTAAALKARALSQEQTDGN